MLKKGSKFYSIFNNKCPKCHEGDFFEHSISLNFKNNLKTYETCKNCGLKYMIEPSFFYGAMYVSYALTVALAVAIFVIFYSFGFGPLTSLIAIIAGLLLLMPVIMRLSRLLYINLFVHYKK